jgi:hypothetical protein
MTKKLSGDELFNLIRPYEVDTLFKYRSFSSKGLEDIFIRQQVFLASPSMFNDPFDCNPRVIIHGDEYKRRKFFSKIIKIREPNATKGKIKSLMSSSRAARLRDPAYLQELFSKMIGGYGVYSMSEVPNDILMWAHYSEAHTGICLEFDAKEIGSLFWEHFKVKYQEEYPIVNVMELGNAKEFLKALTTKASHWGYEKERRVIRTDREGGPGIYKFDPRLLKGVILGVRISAENEKRIRTWIDQYPTRIKLYRAKLNDKFFALDVESCR